MNTQERRPEEGAVESGFVPSRRSFLGMSAAALAAASLPREALAQEVVGFSGPPKGKYALVERITMGFTWAEAQLFNRLGFNGYLEYHLNPAAIPDTYCDTRIANEFPTLKNSAYQNRLYEWWEPVDDTINSFVCRGIFSKRQLLEVMVEFWTDHFNVFAYKVGPWVCQYHRDAIRANALGNWRALLRSVIRHPGMLEYLDNTSNFAGRVNENLGREFLELHTMGADGGYQEADVYAVTRCLTGFSVEWDENNARYGTFKFESWGHDNDEKWLLGRRIPANGGQADMDRVLDIVAFHPSTCRFIARKLIRKFLTYTPSDALVQQVADVMKNTNGDIKAMLRAILTPTNLQTVAVPKVKRPYHFVVSGLRALNAVVPDMYMVWWELLDRAKQVPLLWAPPNGYPDEKNMWISNMLPRWYFGFQFPMNWLWGPRVDLFTQFPTRTRESVTDTIARNLFGYSLPLSRRTQIMNTMSATRPTNDQIREAWGLALNSPEFQLY